MKIGRIVLPLLLLMFSGCASAVSRPAAYPLRVITYNIHAGKDAAQQVNLERVAQLIQSLDADLVFLQEVDRRTQRAGGSDHLAELARLTGRHSAFARAIDFQGGEYGIALLSRFALDSVQVLPLQVHSTRASYEPRVGLYAQVQTPGGRVHLLNTHLDQAAEPDHRSQEVLALLAFLKRRAGPDERLIMGGDLNTRPGSPEMAALGWLFADAWESCGDGGAGHTFPAHAPDRRIDYLLLRGPRCTSARVIASDGSDHRPLLVTIELRGS